MEINAVGNVMGRIDEIRSRLGLATPQQYDNGTLGAASPASGSLGAGASAQGALPSTVAFDPFGAVYQQTLLQNGAGGMGAAGTDPNGQGWAGMSGMSGIEQYPAGGTGATGGTLNPYGHQVGGYGAMAVPPELAVYGNGQVPRAALSPIGQGGHVLYAPAAASFQTMRAAAARDGLQLTITDSYRSYDQQVELAQRKGLSKNGGWAAVPGTSNHGWGLAIDANVNDPKMFAWMQQHAQEFGWVQGAAREPWHWEFRPDQAA
jgi:D-alanyl-D-alanine carboxypeptidase